MPLQHKGVFSEQGKITENTWLGDSTIISKTTLLIAMFGFIKIFLTNVVTMWYPLKSK